MNDGPPSPSSWPEPGRLSWHDGAPCGTDGVVDGFVSYSHDDVSACARLLTQLKSVERKYGLALWHDQRLKAGHHWNHEIEEAIGRAEVFILLVSPEFVRSDYIFDTELPAIKRRLRACKGKAISVVVRDCDWEFACGPTQAVPSFERRLLPIKDWKPHNKGYNTARLEIDAAIADHFGLRPRKPRWPRT
jgi:TIR domain